MKAITLALLLLIVAPLTVEAKRPRRHRAHVVAAIPDYSPWQQYYRRCAEMKAAPAPANETEEARAIRLQAPLIQLGEDARRPINVDPCP